MEGSELMTAQSEAVGTLFKHNVTNTGEVFQDRRQNLAAVLRQFLFLWSSSSAQGGLLWCVVQFITPSSLVSLGLVVQRSL